MTIKIEVYPVRERGGQYVSPEPTWVKVTDDESGLMAACCSERSQFKNREIAFSMIEWGKIVN